MDLDALMDEVAAESAGGVSLDALMDEVAAEQSSEPNDFSIWDFGAQVGSGMIEGNTGLIDLAGQINPFQYGGPGAFGLNKYSSANRSPSLTERVQPFLAEEDPNYRYTRTVGQFIGPTGTAGATAKVLKSIGKAPQIANALSKFGSIWEVGTDVTAGIGAQAAEDYTGDSTIAPIIGAIAGKTAPGAAVSGYKAARAATRGASPDEIAGSAGKVIRDVSDLSPEELERTIKPSAIYRAQDVLEEAAGASSSSTGLPSQSTAADGILLPSASKATQKSPSLETVTSLPSKRYRPETSIDDLLSDSGFIGHYNNTTKNRPALDNYLETVAGGRKFIGDTKELQSAARKVATKIKEVDPNYTEQNLTDLVRGTIVAEDPDDVIRVAQNAAKERGIKIVPGSVDDYFSRPNKWGYEGLHYNVEFPDGSIGEVQIHTPSSLRAKNKTHQIFKEWRDTPSGDIPVSAMDDSAAIVQFEKANPSLPERLRTFRTTAEVTEDAPLAQLEKELGGRPEFSGEYYRRADSRAQVRDDILDSVSATKGVPDDFGDALMGKARATEEALNENAKALWKDFPRDTEIDTLPHVAKVEKLLGRQQAGTALKGDAKLLVDQFIDTAADEPIIKPTSGALQDIRSDVLSELRENTRLKPRQREVLTEVANEIENALNNQLLGTDAANYEAAREATKYRRELFNRTTPGGTLTNPNTLPENAVKNAFKGSKKAARQLKEALDNDPAIIEDLRRAIVEEIPRDAGEALTPYKFKQFIEKKKTGLKEIFGDDHYSDMVSILDDLQSEAKVSKIAGFASKGQSITSQKQTVAGVLDSLFSEATQQGSFIMRGFRRVFEGSSVRNKEQLQRLLFDAMMDPELAVELAKTPSTERVMGVMERLGDFAMRSRLGATKAGTVATATSSLQSQERPPREGYSSKRPSRAPQLTKPSSNPAPTPRASQQNLAPSSVFDSPNEEASVFYQPAAFRENSVFDSDITADWTVQPLEEQAGMKRMSERGIDLLKRFEGFRGAKYEDSAGVPTIGYGFTGDEVDQGEMTEDEAERVLREEYLPQYEQAVADLVKVPLKQNEFDALVSLTYNIGPGAFAQSTLLKKLNEGDKEGAAREFSKWVYADGKKLEGLKKRRAAERITFLSSGEESLA